MFIRIQAFTYLLFPWAWLCLSKLWHQFFVLFNMFQVHFSFSGIIYQFATLFQALFFASVSGMFVFCTMFQAVYISLLHVCFKPCLFQAWHNMFLFSNTCCTHCSYNISLLHYNPTCLPHFISLFLFSGFCCGVVCHGVLRSFLLYYLSWVVYPFIFVCL